MATATIHGESRSPAPDPAGVEIADAGRLAIRPAATGLLSGVQPPAPASGALLEETAPADRVPFYKPMPTSVGFALRAEALAPAPRGYAAPSAAAAKAANGSTAKSSSGKAESTKASVASSASKASTRELAFLDDKHLSIQDKLYQFMMLMTKKSDQELIDAMKEYEGKKTASKSSSSSESTSGSKTSSSSGTKSVLTLQGGGGFFGALGDALGGIGEAIVGGAESLAKDLGGPLLASAATAVGLPFLAPVALKIGGDLSAGLVEGVASSVGLGKSSGSTASGSSASKSVGSGSGSKSGASSSKKTSGAADPEEFDEKLEMFKLQRLVEKQSAMFAALTNAMKSMHDTQMTAVQNIR